jgi:hypothetical protein
MVECSSSTATAGVWGSKPGFGYATCVYSLITPPRMGRRWARAAATSITVGGGNGGRWASDRCGRDRCSGRRTHENYGELTFADDEDAVEALRPDAARPAFGVGVRPRCLRRRLDHLNELGREGRVEGDGELGVAVADQEPQLGDALLEVYQHVACLLGDPLAGWGAVARPGFSCAAG